MVDKAADGVRQHIEAEGFGQISVCAGFVEQIGDPVVIEPGDNDNMATLGRCLDPGKEFQAVDIGHPYVHQDKIGATLLEVFKGLLCRGRDLHRMTFGFKKGLQEVTESGFIIDNENA